MFETFIHDWINKRIFPGLSILVAKQGNILLERQFGYKAIWPAVEPLSDDTIYDLASLTKPLITSFLVVHLLEKKQLHIKYEVKRFFPNFPMHITLEQLLTNCAGFEPWHPFYLYRPLDDLAQVARMINLCKPGKKVIYSDIGYILLRHILEKTTGLEFKKLAADVILQPLKLQNSYFLVPETGKIRCAPTEIGNGIEREMSRKKHESAAANFSWRTELIRGEVHDANSYYVGGSAGNAGLFASARDVFKICSEFFPETATLLKADSIGWFWKNRTPWSKLHRSLGFKLNSSRPTSGGCALSEKAIGHNGFTGTSLWLEPEKQTQYIILTNRVHPQLIKMNFDAVRRKLHFLLKRELG